MKIYSLAELLRTAREQSSYYRKLYVGVAEFADGRVPELSQLPIVDQTEFWAANTIQHNQLLTRPMADGIVFKSGGTTGSPKFSVFSQEEWDSFTEVFSRGLSANGLKSGQRIANLFYVGELYASFIFIMKSIEQAVEPALHFPIAGTTSPEEVLKIVGDFDVDVIAGVPTTLLVLAEYFSRNKSRYPKVSPRKILFGGESMYSDQRERLQEIFPGVDIRSIGYASVDAGPIGYADPECGQDEHRVFGDATHLEIVDEDTGEVILEPKRPGRILLTNRTRILMPIIRYPVGDRAQWVEEVSPGFRDRKYVILGRSGEAARVGPVSIYYEDMRAFLAPRLLGMNFNQFQLVIAHRMGRDLLVVRIGASAQIDELKAFEKKVIAEFSTERPMFAESVAKGLIHPLEIEWVDPRLLTTNPRTGKLKRIIDQRKA
ncbi:MAG: hypothetical protein A2X94_08185 [Bdellovibrionales bacterium GWB1_55_8]|nr:MAG: hypothetical protein A2X94_08185 [Bdellovibrionales bacterium GWB1_55_8]